MNKKTYVLAIAFCALLTIAATLPSLVEMSSPTSDDILYVVDNPAGAASDKKIRIDNLFSNNVLRGNLTLSGLTGKSTNLYNLQQGVLVDGSGAITAPAFISTGAGSLTADSAIVTNKFTNSYLTASQAVVSGSDKSLSSVPYTGSGNVMRTRTGVQRTVWISAGAMNPSASSPATAVTNTWNTTTDGQTKEAYDFDADAAGESVQSDYPLPPEWDAGTIKVRFFWKPVNATSGDVVWGIAAGSMTDNETGGNTLGTEATVTDTVQTGTNTLHVTAWTSAITVGGSPSAGHYVWYKPRRLGSNGSDTMTNKARLFGIQVSYTESTTEPSAP